MSEHNGVSASRATATDLHDPSQRDRVEAAMRRVSGVLAARLVAGYEREVDEVHVLVGLGNTPKLVVRDLQSLLMASFGVTTDHRVFSVVALDEGTVTTETGRRVVLAKTAITSRGGEVQVDVELADEQGERTTASATGSAEPRSRIRAAAQATLAAVGEVAGEMEAELEGAEAISRFETEIALVVIAVGPAHHRQLVTGSAPVRGDVLDATARATLDAVNRLLALKRS